MPKQEHLLGRGNPAPFSSFLFLIRFQAFRYKTYAKSCIVLQPYQNLFDMNAAFYAGTIFKDLYSPYCAIKYSKEEKHD